MPGLVPGIHVFLTATPKDVDGRVKPGHDEQNRMRRALDKSTPIDETSARYEGWRIVAVCFWVATFGWASVSMARAFISPNCIGCMAGRLR